MNEEKHALNPEQARNMAREFRVSAKNYASGKFSAIGKTNLVSAVGSTIVRSEQTADMYATALESYAEREEAKSSSEVFEISRELLEEVLQFIDSKAPDGDTEYDKNLVATNEPDALYDRLRDETGHEWS